ncbi:abscisic acid 8'-hydroxylase 3-like isoform X1 [Arachis stenosperma]|uniref:abscisic acid 8'-hydroxylase 3-like isoform X1 n=2 Tax=Arachis stenosperma TaxID=217475 RepID=UPI0025ABF644|nr:abscisic acid 8'-hydroxylase 3-like isoform X1 [Arachis stenosperma]
MHACRHLSETINIGLQLDGIYISKIQILGIEQSVQCLCSDIGNISLIKFTMMTIMGVINLVIFLIVSLFVVSIVVLMYVTRSPKEMKGIPGNLGWPILGETLSFISDFSSPSGIFSFMHNRQQRYGKVFKSFVLGRFTVFMTGREASKILLTGKDGIVSLNLFYTGQQVLGPTSLLQTNGEPHKRLRRLIAEPLSIDGLKKYFHFINTQAMQTLDHWQGRKVLVLEEASTFTLKVIGHMIMSLEPTSEEQEKFRSNFKIISSSFSSMPIKLPGTAFHRGIKARDRMYEMLDSIIARRRSGQEFQQDFLESLIMKHSKGGAEGEDDENKLTDKQLKDNVLTLLVAGHDTTTAALTWLIKFLEENLHVLEQLREEHRGIIANRKSGTDLTWSEVNNMPYTAKVISETLRRATILPWYSRKASQDFEVDGYKIKKGWSVNLDVVSIHHDPEVFPDPQNFDPSRFDEPLRPFSFLGFGSGPRMCPGMNLAKIEICVFIHHLVTRYKWKPLDRDNSVQPTLVRMPKNKYPVLVEPL